MTVCETRYHDSRQDNNPATELVDSFVAVWNSLELYKFIWPFLSLLCYAATNRTMHTIANHCEPNFLRFAKEPKFTEECRANAELRSMKQMWDDAG